MKLFFREIGEGRPMIIVHGLFGVSDNWLTMAKRLGRFRKLFILDLRNHGQSPRSNTFDYQSMVADLEEFIREHDISKPDLLGHSLGGKIVMNFAARHSEAMDKLIVVDIAPKYYKIHHDVILEGLKAIEIDKIGSRSEADEVLAEFVENLGVRQFLLKNLKRNDEGFEWKMNLEVIYNKIVNVGAGLDKKIVVENPTLFIRGGRSRYILDEDFPGIFQQFPNATIETIENASHWVHAEHPEAMCKLIENFLKDDE